MSEHEAGTRRGHRRHVAGSTLVVLGLVLFLVRLSGRPADNTLVLFTVGGVFLAWYLYRRRYGLLIPACVLLGLGVGRVIDRTSLNISDGQALGLGLGFVAIFILDMVVRDRSPWWPLIPGAILLVKGVGLDFAPADWFLTKGWPLVLVAIGILILTGVVGRPPRE
ncbi:MAG: hypothetical protein V3V49_08315 [Candidatus Krumholzibacteria bacterium]